MLKYLVIVLDDTSVSYCHYTNSYSERRLMPLEVLKEGILFAMKYNLHIQYVLPEYMLPNSYNELIESYPHDNIGSLNNQEFADVVVVDSLQVLHNAVDLLKQEKRYVLRTSIRNFLKDWELLISIFSRKISVNVVYTDIENFSDELISDYSRILSKLASCLHTLIRQGISVNTNLITDRIALSEMNNCGAGSSVLTLCPDGRLYPCPAFYNQDDRQYYSTDFETPQFNNPQLFNLSHSPLCKKCDAFQCKRCVWLNKKLTCEINVPSHEQCVISHIERNTSKELLTSLQKDGMLRHVTILSVDYLDPFDLFNNKLK